MIKTRDHIDPRTLLREFDASSPHGSDDVGLSDADHFAVHIANEKSRSARDFDRSEAVMMAVGALCILGMVWLVVWGW